MSDDLLNADQSIQGQNDSPKKPNRSKNWPTGDIMIAIFFLVFAVLMLVGAVNFTSRPQMGRLTSPKFTPILLSILVMIFCVALIAITLKKNAALSVSGWFKEVFSDEQMRRSLVLIAMFTIYIVLVGILDFVVVNGVFFLVMYSYLKIGGWLRIVIYSAVSTVVVSVLVPLLFNMPTP